MRSGQMFADVRRERAQAPVQIADAARSKRTFFAGQNRPKGSTT
jgi:hypothetical protein